MTIRTRLLSTILISTIVPILGFIAVVGIISRQSLYAFVAARSKSTTQELARQVTLRHAHYLETLNQLAASPLLTSALAALRPTKGAMATAEAKTSRNELDEILPTVATTNEFEDITLFDGKGILLYATDEETQVDIGKRPSDGPLVDAFHFAETGTNDTFVLSDPEEDGAHHSMFLAHAYRNDRELEGMMVIHIPFSAFQNIFDSLHSLGASAEAYAVIDEGHNAHIISEVKSEADSNATVLPYNNERGKGGQRAAKGETGSGNVIDYSGEPSLSSWTYLPKLKVGIVTKIELTEVLAAITNLRLPVFTILTGFLVILSIIISVIVYRYVSHPLSHLRDVTKQIAHGETPEVIDHTLLYRHDEIGEIATSLHGLAQAAKHGVSATANVSNDNPEPLPASHYQNDQERDK